MLVKFVNIFHLKIKNDPLSIFFVTYVHVCLAANCIKETTLNYREKRF